MLQGNATLRTWLPSQQSNCKPSPIASDTHLLAYTGWLVRVECTRQHSIRLIAWRGFLFRCAAHLHDTARDGLPPVGLLWEKPCCHACCLRMRNSDSLCVDSGASNRLKSRALCSKWLQSRGDKLHIMIPSMLHGLTLVLLRYHLM